MKTDYSDQEDVSGSALIRARIVPLRAVGAVERAIVDGFGNVSGIDFVGIFEVGDRAADFQNAIVSSRREPPDGSWRVPASSRFRCQCDSKDESNEASSRHSRKFPRRRVARFAARAL